VKETATQPLLNTPLSLGELRARTDRVVRFVDLVDNHPDRAHDSYASKFDTYVSPAGESMKASYYGVGRSAYELNRIVEANQTVTATYAQVIKSAAQGVEVTRSSRGHHGYRFHTRGAKVIKFPLSHDEARFHWEAVQKALQ
jgi:hypothetical protein